WAAGCGGDSGNGPRPDGATTTDGGGHDSRPVGPLSYAGVYDSDGVWDLSGPITAKRTLGDVVSDLLIEEIVGAAGVPSALEDQATDAVHDLVGDKVKSLVDAAAPDALKPGSDLMMKLATVLASAQVTSTID